MDYNKIKDKYQDSLSQFNIDEVLDNPNFWSLKFWEIKTIVNEIINTLYSLEINDFRSKLPHNTKQKVEGFRNSFKNLFSQIQNFKIEENNPTQTRQNIIQQINNSYNNEYYDIKSILNNIILENLLNQPWKEDIKKELNKVQEIKNEIKNAKNEISKELERVKKISESAWIWWSQIWSIKIWYFFKEQSSNHKKECLWENNWDFWFNWWWFWQRKIFYRSILWIIVFNLIMYWISIFYNPFSKLFTIEYWILIWSLLWLLYLWMTFITNNYFQEKQLEIENISKSNIADTLELFLQWSQSENNREIILQEAVKTLFTLSKIEFKQEKTQNINTPITEITKILNTKWV